MGLSRLKPDLVGRVFIEQMLEAANWAPSHGDTEPWRFTVFAGEGRAALAEPFEQAQQEDAARNPQSRPREGAEKRAFAAPVWISIGMVPGRKADGSLQMSIEEELMAVACAVQNLHLMASALELAGMWHSKGTSVHPAVARGLGLEAPDRLLSFFMCGWPAGDWLRSTRRPLSEKVIRSKAVNVAELNFDLCVLFDLYSLFSTLPTLGYFSAAMHDARSRGRFDAAAFGANHR